MARGEVIVNFYDRWVLPPILDLVMRQNQLKKYRREVVAAAGGRVLEVGGGGSGLNFPLYGKQVRDHDRDRPLPPVCSRLRADALRGWCPRCCHLDREMDDLIRSAGFRHAEPSNRIRKRATSNDLHVPRRGTIGGMILRL